MSYALRCRAARTCSRRALETTISRIRAATNSDLRFYTTPPATIALETHVRSSSQRQHASSATELQLLGRNRKRFNIDNIRRYASQAEESSSTGEDNPGLQEAVSYVKNKQNEAPWQREGSQAPPVEREKAESEKKKGASCVSLEGSKAAVNNAYVEYAPAGKLLSTPSRLLKLILPVTTHEHDDHDQKGA